MKIKNAILALTVCVGFANAHAADIPTVRVSLFSWPGYGFWFIAKEKNLAPDINLDIQIIEDPYESFGQMTAGNLDVASSTGEYGPIAADAANGIKLVAITNPSIGTDKIILAPKIEKAEDLKGKSVAVLEGGLTQIFMAMWLEKNGVKFDEVKYVNVVMDDAVSAMVSGKVAAGEFWEPFGGQVLKSLKGSKAVANSGEEEWLKTGLLGDGLYMSDAFLTKTPEIAKKTMNAYWDAVDWWRKNPAEGNAIIAKGIKFDVKDVEDVLGKDDKPFSGGIYCFDLSQAAQFMGVIPGNPPLGLKNDQIKEHWALTSKWWLKFGLIKRENPIDSGISFEPIKSLIQP